MKLVKRLVVLVAALTMALGLVACGGEKYPLEYKYESNEPGVQGMKASLTLEEDGTFKYTFVATSTNDPSKVVMDLEATGTYTKDGDTVTIELGDVKGYAMNGESKIDMSSEMGYKLSYAKGATQFTVDGETFTPVLE